MLNNWQVCNKSSFLKWGTHKRAVLPYLTTDAYKRLKTKMSYVNIAYKVCPKNWHYCHWKSIVASVNNHSSACHSEMNVLLYLIFSNVKKKYECFRKIFQATTKQRIQTKTNYQFQRAERAPQKQIHIVFVLKIN